MQVSSQDIERMHLCPIHKKGGNRMITHSSLRYALIDNGIISIIIFVIGFVLGIVARAVLG